MKTRLTLKWPAARIRLTIGAWMLCLPTAPCVRAQSAPIVSPRATVFLNEEARSTPAFGHLTFARELPDGRVLVADAQNRALAVLGKTLGGVRQLGRTGDGPGEYRSPSMLLAIGNDSSLVVDGLTRRWLLLVADRFVSLTDNLRSLERQWRGELVGVTSALSLTHIGVGPTRDAIALGFRGQPAGHERVAVVLHAASGRDDTVFVGSTLYFGFARKRGPASTGGMLYLGLHPLQSYDQAALFPDGRVALVQVSPFEVSWRSGTGQLLGSVSMVDSSPRLTAEMKRTIAADNLRLANGEAVYAAADFATWPETVPPFTSRALVAGLDGRLYVQRTQIGASSRRRVDVFSLGGGHEGAFFLQPAERLLGVGVHGIYTARENDDGEEMLVRSAPVVFKH